MCQCHQQSHPDDMMTIDIYHDNDDNIYDDNDDNDADNDDNIHDDN